MINKKLEIQVRERTQDLNEAVTSAEQAVELCCDFKAPDFVIARKKKFYWQVQSKIFDYQGQIRKANQL